MKTWKHAVKANVVNVVNRYTDIELKAILRKYRQLPGVAGVRMDRLEALPPRVAAETMTLATNATLSLPPARTLRSWMRLSNVHSSQIVVDPGDEDGGAGEEEEEEDVEEGEHHHHLFRHHRHRWETSSCINET